MENIDINEEEIEQELTINVGDIFIDDKNYSKRAEWCNSNGCYIEEIEPKEDGVRQFQIKKPKESTEEEKMENLKKSIISSVQSELDKTAQSKGYDNGFACASYSYSTDSIFKQEAQAYVEWRDKVWRYCYDLLDKYLKGEIEQPSIEYVLANMPKINWE